MRFVRVELHEVAVVRMIVRMHDERRQAVRRTMRVDQTPEIDVEQHVAVHEEKGIRELVGDLVQPTRRAEGSPLAVHAHARERLRACADVRVDRSARCEARSVTSSTP